MTGKNKTALFFCGMIVLVAALYLVSTEEITPTPSDSLHAGSFTNESCGECHGEGRENPLQNGHPPKFQCLTCHEKRN